MSDGPFIARLSEAIQRQHEATGVLQQLASELVDHTVRMKTFTDKLQAHLVGPETPARARQDVVVPEAPAYTFGSEPLTLPRSLQGGPVRGER